MADSLAKSVEATKAEYKQVGKSGLRVSVPILGAMSLGDPAWVPWVLDEEKVDLPCEHCANAALTIAVVPTNTQSRI